MSQRPIDSLAVDRVLDAAGPAAGVFARMGDALWRQPHLPPPTLELCRLWLARLHRADADLAVRAPIGNAPAEPKIAALLAESWLSDPAFTAAERAALEFTEYYFLDPQNITDEAAQAVLDHFGEAGLVALVEALGFIDGRMRLGLFMGDLLDSAGAEPGKQEAVR